MKILANLIIDVTLYSLLFHIQKTLSVVRLPWDLTCVVNFVYRALQSPSAACKTRILWGHKFQHFFDLFVTLVTPIYRTNFDNILQVWPLAFKILTIPKFNQAYNLVYDREKKYLCLCVKNVGLISYTSVLLLLKL